MRPVKCIDLTAVSASVYFRHITLVHACMTQTLDCSRVDSLFSLIVMTDLDCHKVNLPNWFYKSWPTKLKVAFHVGNHSVNSNADLQSRYFSPNLPPPLSLSGLGHWMLTATVSLLIWPYAQDSENWPVSPRNAIQTFADFWLPTFDVPTKWYDYVCR